MKVDVIVWLLGLVVMIVASFKVKFSQSYSPSFQPSRVAFSIWWLIFVSLAASSTLLFYEDKEYIVPAILLCVSMLSCAAWTRVNSTNLAVWTLLNACVFAFLATWTFTPFWIRAGPSLLAGWLSVALALGVTIHLHDYGQIEEQEWFPLPFLLTNVVLAVALEAPIVSVPLVWSALFAPSINKGLLFGTLGVLGCGLSAARVFHDTRG
tara:strand:- start:468 stop:1094 length:627 start_codon:yes stop_codon:yes gene_type:complete